MRVLWLCLCAMSLAYITLGLPPKAGANTLKCSPAKNLVRGMTKIKNMPAELTDPLYMDMTLQISHQDGTPLTAQSLYYQYESVTIPIEISARGMLLNAIKLAGQSEDGEFCRESQTGAPIAQDTSLSVSVDFIFKPVQGGVYDISKLEEGLSEGRMQMKAAAPKFVSLFLPKLTHIAIAPDVSAGRIEQAAPRSISFLKNGEPMAFETGALAPMSEQAGVLIYRFKDLKKTGADQLVISGGPYRLEAMPNPK